MPDYTDFFKAKRKLLKNMKKHGGARPNAGRKKLNKFKKTFSLDAELKECKITSRVVNELLLNEYRPKNI